MYVRSRGSRALSGANCFSVLHQSASLPACLSLFWSNQHAFLFFSNSFFSVLHLALSHSAPPVQLQVGVLHLEKRQRRCEGMGENWAAGTETARRACLPVQRQHWAPQTRIKAQRAGFPGHMHAHPSHAARVPIPCCRPGLPAPRHACICTDARALCRSRPSSALARLPKRSVSALGNLGGVGQDTVNDGGTAGSAGDDRQHHPHDNHGPFHLSVHTEGSGFLDENNLKAMTEHTWRRSLFACMWVGGYVGLCRRGLGLFAPCISSIFFIIPICIHTSIHASIDTFIHKHTRTYSHTHTHTHIHTYISTNLHTNIQHT